MRRSLPFALAVALALSAGFLVGRAGYGPSATAQTVECNPTQAVPPAALQKLQAMDRKLDRLIEDYRKGEVGTRELNRWVDTIIGLKLDLMDTYPPVFGHAFVNHYRLLRGVDNNLNDAVVHQTSSGKKAVQNDLESARAFKKQLEGLLQSSPCSSQSPSPT